MNSLPLHILPDGSYRTFPIDLGLAGYRWMMRAVNDIDRAYRYEDPDHWRLPADTGEIPYRFCNAKGAADALG